MLERIEALIKTYQELAEQHGRATEIGDARVANECHDRVVETLRDLDGASNEGRRVLRGVLGHENAHVRVCVATHLIKLYPEECKAVLDEVASQAGLAAFNAGMVLDLWRAGKLKIP